ncbi:E3 ubiquitin-protein ligase RFWD2, partial [Aphelenchoides avenae]
MSVVDGEVIETEVRSSLGMHLQMKLKISDKPVKCITKTRFNNEDVVISGAGNYGDEEAVLRWRRDKNS